MPEIGLPETTLISLFLEAIVYAFFVAFSGTTFWILTWGSSSGNVSKPMLITLLLMFVLATMHLAVDLRRVLAAFVYYAADPDSYLKNIRRSSYIFKSGIYTFQTLVGDSFATYRTYVIWKDWRVCILPSLLLIANIVTGTGLLVSFTEITPATVVFAKRLRAWIISFFVIAFFSQVLCTCLIAYRITKIDREMAVGSMRRSLRPITLIVIESGAIYALSLLTVLIVYCTGSWAQYMILDMLPSLIGIVFSFIIIRIGLEPRFKRIGLAQGTRRSTIPQLDSIAHYPTYQTHTRASWFLPPTLEEAESSNCSSPVSPRSSASERGRTVPRLKSPTRLRTAHLPTLRAGPELGGRHAHALAKSISPILNIHQDNCYDYDYDTRSYVKSPAVEKQFEFHSHDSTSPTINSDLDEDSGCSSTGGGSSLSGDSPEPRPCSLIARRLPSS